MHSRAGAQVGRTAQLAVFGVPPSIAAAPPTLSALSLVDVPPRRARKLAARCGALRHIALQFSAAGVAAADLEPLDAWAPASLVAVSLAGSAAHLGAPLGRAPLRPLAALDVHVRREAHDTVALRALDQQLERFGGARLALRSGGFGPHRALPAGVLRPTLTALSVLGLRVTAAHVERLATHCSALRTLDLGAFPATDAGALAALERLTALRSLSLAWTDRRGAVTNGRFADNNLWSSVARLTALEALSAHGLPPPIGFAATVTLTRLTSLQMLNIANTEELDVLAHFARLRSLHLSFVDLKQTLTELQTLPLSVERLSINLVPTVQRGDRKLPTLAVIERLTRLRVLEIRRQKLPTQIPDEFFARAVARLPSLEAVSLSGFVQVGVLTLSALASLPRVRWLRLRHVDGSVLAALHHAEQLRVLEIDRNELPAFGVAPLTQLRVLSIHGAERADLDAAASGPLRSVALLTNNAADMPLDIFDGPLANALDEFEPNRVV